MTGEELKIITLSLTSLDLSCCTTDIRINSACVLKGPPGCVETALQEAQTAPGQAGGCAILRRGSVAHQAGGCGGGGRWLDSGYIEGKAGLTPDRWGC